MEAGKYHYDALGNLLSVDLPDGRLVEYVIDGQNRRIGKKIDGVLTKAWLYQNQLSPIAELDGSGNLTARFIYGSKPNTPDVVIKYSGGLVTTYRVITDHLGSPVMAVNVNNSSDVSFNAEYSAFGERTVSSGASSEGWLPFGFAGGLYDADTRLTRFGARDYDPVAGRWVSKDPILFDGGQTNLFVYVGNDPVNKVDPSGLAVYLCHRVADLPGNQLFQMEHHFILTDSTSAGMGACGGGVPGHGGIDWPYITDTCVNDHSSENASSSEPGGLQCDLMSNVDESCVDDRLQIGRPLGKWAPWNQCQSFAADVLMQCRTGGSPCGGGFNGSEGAPGFCGG